jgi:hypothetical protein
VNQTATDLRAALNASTHPYFSTITWSGSSGSIIGTADVAGVPFVAALTKTGAGTGTVTDFASTTANAGPNVWGTAANWSGATVPGAADTVILRQSTVPIAWDLDQNALSLTRLVIEDSYTGTLGLNRSTFALSASGGNPSSAATEYRQGYLAIQATTVEIGARNPGASALGASRIKIDNRKSAASTTIVYHTAASSADSGLPAVRLLAAHANADLYVLDAQGGVGVAVDAPGETSTLGIVSIADDTGVSRVQTGEGVTLTTWSQQGGTNELRAAATVTTVEVLGGELTIEGDYTITTLTIAGGNVIDNHIKSGGNAITTVNQTGGLLDGSQSTRARTWATVNPDSGSIRIDDSVVTITTLDKPAGLRTLTVV